MVKIFCDKRFEMLYSGVIKKSPAVLFFETCDVTMESGPFGPQTLNYVLA